MKVKGTRQDDHLSGTSGDDVIIGGRGDDVIRSGGGSLDIMKGGKGRDTFVISTDQFALIRDFQPGKDQLVLVDDLSPQPLGVTPLEPSDFGTIVTINNGVVEYQGSPVVAVGHVAVGYDDLFLN